MEQISLRFDFEGITASTLICTIKSRISAAHPRLCQIRALICFNHSGNDLGPLEIKALSKDRPYAKSIKIQDSG